MSSADSGQLLAHAIIKTTCDDYANAHLGYRVGGKNPKSVVRECRDFFTNGTFDVLSGGKIDANRVMKDVLMNAVDTHLTLVKKILDSPRTPRISIDLRIPEEEDIHYTVPPIFASNLVELLKEKLTEELKDLSKGHATLCRIDNDVS